MSELNSHRLGRFRNGFLNADCWEQRKDGPPLYLLDELTEEEKMIAARELCDAAVAGDSWHVSGIGHLKSKESLPRLYSLLDEGGPGFKIATAHSIFLINRDPSMIRIAIHETARIESLSELIDVIYLLPGFHDTKINKILEELRTHTEYLIAYNATRALGYPTDELVQKFRNLSGQSHSPEVNSTAAKSARCKKFFGRE